MQGTFCLTFFFKFLKKVHKKYLLDSTVESGGRRKKRGVTRRRKPFQLKGRLLTKPTPSSQASSLVIKHIRKFYNFTWTANNFRLEDEFDAINYGELVVSPPPSGQGNASLSLSAFLPSFESSANGNL